MCTTGQSSARRAPQISSETEGYWTTPGTFGWEINQHVSAGDDAECGRTAAIPRKIRVAVLMIH
jgi:hypothetical protein